MLALAYVQEAGPSPVQDNSFGLIIWLIAVAIVVIFGVSWLRKKKMRRTDVSLGTLASDREEPPAVKRHERAGAATQTPHATASSQTVTNELQRQPRSKGDVFISYASADRSVAQALASALSGRGLSIWWDRTIPPGKSFDEVIETALSGAKCVVVLWSKSSVASDWVKVEAADAAKRRILIPALIEEVTIPLEFRRLQAADLIGWQGSVEHAGYQSLIDSISQLPGITTV